MSVGFPFCPLTLDLDPGPTRLSPPQPRLLNPQGPEPRRTPRAWPGYPSLTSASQPLPQLLTPDPRLPPPKDSRPVLPGAP